MNEALALVTGASGWLGARLAARLAADGWKIKSLEGDIADPRAVAAFLAGGSGATLFHAAGVIHPRRVVEFYRVNTVGTRLLVAGAEAVGVRRLLHVSSNSPFGFNPSREHRFDERSPYHPYRNYGRSKMLAEQAVTAARSLDWVIVRTPWFYGPGGPARQARFFTMIQDGKAPIVGGGENLRSMAFVDNLVDGLLLAAASPAASRQHYWMADRRPYSMNEIVATVQRVMERDFGLAVRHRRLRLPALAGAVAGWADAAIQGFGFYNQELHVLSELGRDIACSIEKAERELGYCPKVELEEGMRASLEGLRAQGIHP